ncbi:MAG: hypothetical protein EOM72_07400 [Opitutae bacterium]|nr:hypothetical protein [Opitutae bacterium]
MSWKDFPLSCLWEGSCSTLGGVLAFFAGMVGGTLIVAAQAGSILQGDGAAYLIGWMFLVLRAMADLRGLVLLPFLGIMLFGLVWRDWNRLAGAALVALVLAGISFLTADCNLFAEPESTRRLALTAGPAVLLLLAGLAREIWARHRLRRLAR